MVYTVALIGGPPWGFRLCPLSDNSEMGAAVAQVIPLGHAAKEGIRVGDALKSLNGKSVVNCSFEQIQRQLKKTAGIIRISLQREPERSAPPVDSVTSIQPKATATQQPLNVICPAPDVLPDPKMSHHETSPLLRSQSAMLPPISPFRLGSQQRRYGPVSFTPTYESSALNSSGSAAPFAPQSAPISPRWPLGPSASEPKFRTFSSSDGPHKIDFATGNNSPSSPALAITASSVKRDDSINQVKPVDSRPMETVAYSQEPIYASVRGPNFKASQLRSGPAVWTPGGTNTSDWNRTESTTNRQEWTYQSPPPPPQPSDNFSSSQSWQDSLYGGQSYAAESYAPPAKTQNFAPAAPSRTYQPPPPPLAAPFQEVTSSPQTPSSAGPPPPPPPPPSGGQPAFKPPSFLNTSEPDSGEFDPNRSVVEYPEKQSVAELRSTIQSKLNSLSKKPSTNGFSSPSASTPSFSSAKELKYEPPTPTAPPPPVLAKTPVETYIQQAASYSVNHSLSTPVIPPAPVLDSYASALKEATEGLITTTSYTSSTSVTSKLNDREDFESKSLLSSPPKPLGSRSQVQLTTDAPPPPLKVFDVGTTSNHQLDTSFSRSSVEVKPTAPIQQSVPISKPLTIESFTTPTTNLPLDSPAPPRPPPPPDMMSPTPPVVPPPPAVSQSSATRSYDRPDNFARPYTNGIFRSGSVPMVKRETSPFKEAGHAVPLTSQPKYSEASYYAVPYRDDPLLPSSVRYSSGPSEKRFDRVEPRPEVTTPSGSRREFHSPDYQHQWYKMMYRKLHHLDNPEENSVLKYRMRDYWQERFLEDPVRHREPNPYTVTYKFSDYLADLDPDERGYAMKPFAVSTLPGRARSRSDRVDSRSLRSKSTGRYEMSPPPSEVVKSSPGVTNYRVEPRSIENYVPGASTLAEYEQERQRPGSSLSRPSTASGHYSSRLYYNFDRDERSFEPRKREVTPPRPDEVRHWYKSVQTGGEVPHSGLRIPAPERIDSYFKTSLIARLHSMKGGSPTKEPPSLRTVSTQTASGPTERSRRPRLDAVEYCPLVNPYAYTPVSLESQRKAAGTPVKGSPKAVCSPIRTVDKSSGLYAAERQKTKDFHLPSFRIATPKTDKPPASLSDFFYPNPSPPVAPSVKDKSTVTRGYVKTVKTVMDQNDLEHKYNFYRADKVAAERLYYSTYKAAENALKEIEIMTTPRQMPYRQGSIGRDNPRLIRKTSMYRSQSLPIVTVEPIRTGSYLVKCDLRTGMPTKKCVKRQYCFPRLLGKYRTLERGDQVFSESIKRGSVVRPERYKRPAARKETLKRHKSLQQISENDEGKLRSSKSLDDLSNGDDDRVAKGNETDPNAEVSSSEEMANLFTRAPYNEILTPAGHVRAICKTFSSGHRLDTDESPSDSDYQLCFVSPDTIEKSRYDYFYPEEICRPCEYFYAPLALVNMLELGIKRSLSMPNIKLLVEDTNRKRDTRAKATVPYELLEETKFSSRHDGFVQRQHEPVVQSSTRSTSSRNYFSESVFKEREREFLMEEERRRKLEKEIAEQQSRRHGYTSGIAVGSSIPPPPDRYDHLFDDVKLKEPSVQEQFRTAVALYTFRAESPKELSFKKGDEIRLRRVVDKNWCEGELNGRVGMFPSNYVSFDTEKAALVKEKSPPEPIVLEGSAKVLYNFKGRNINELNLTKGETVALTKRVDANWWEGRNQVGRTGIFPTNYVKVLRDPTSEATVTVPPPPPTPFVDSYRHSEPEPIPLALKRLEDMSKLLVNGLELDKSSSIKSDFMSTLPSYERVTTEVKSHRIGPISLPPPKVEPTRPVAKSGDNLYEVVYNYSPQNNDELELKEGDWVSVMEKCEDGWYIGTSLKSGRFGTFPGNYVKLLCM